MNIYKIASLGTSLLFLFLFVQLFFMPDAFVTDMGLETSAAVPILGRRTSMFMLGLSVLLFCVRKLPLSTARSSICLSTGITMTGLACLSSYELIRGTVNQSIWTAIIIESISAILFWIVFLKDLRLKIG